MSAAIMLHAGAGSLGILSGAVAITARKGCRLHRISGTIFFCAMLTTAAMGGYLAATRGQRGNELAGAFTFYLVLSAWMTVRRQAGRTGAPEAAIMLLGAAVAARGFSFGLQAASNATGELDGTAPPLFYVFASMATFAATLDLTAICRSGLAGTPRLARHVWRMCAGLFIATGSFFLGQQKIMPAAMHGSPVLLALALAPLAAMVFWLGRIRLSRRFLAASTG